MRSAGFLGPSPDPSLFSQKARLPHSGLNWAGGVNIRTPEPVENSCTGLLGPNRGYTQKQDHSGQKGVPGRGRPSVLCALGVEGGTGKVPCGGERKGGTVGQ